MSEEAQGDQEREISEALDVFGQVEGAILYRGPEMWEILEPGEIGQVLAIGQDGLPDWFWRDELPTAQ